MSRNVEIGRGFSKTRPLAVGTAWSMNQEGSLPTHTPRPSAQTHAPNMAFSRQNRGLTFKAVP